jgi:hypothetical protein
MTTPLLEECTCVLTVGMRGACIDDRAHRSIVVLGAGCRAASVPQRDEPGRATRGRQQRSETDARDCSWRADVMMRVIA